jgi:hypothetical protein
MKEQSIAASPRARKTVHVLGWAVLALLSLLLLPFLLHALRNFADWFTGLFPHLSHLWEDSPWSY